MTRRTHPDFMTGVPEMLILRLLAVREMYGYELAQAIEKATGERIRMGEGVLYSTLHALEARGCLKARRRPINGRTRIYYTLTQAGHRQLTHLRGEWSRINEAVSAVLEGSRHADASV